jgi:hypothetical protein
VLFGILQISNVIGKRIAASTTYALRKQNVHTAPMLLFLVRMLVLGIILQRAGRYRVFAKVERKCLQVVDRTASPVFVHMQTHALHIRRMSSRRVSGNRGNFLPEKANSGEVRLLAM